MVTRLVFLRHYIEPLFGDQLGIQEAIYPRIMTAHYRGMFQFLTRWESCDLPGPLKPDRFLLCPRLTVPRVIRMVTATGTAGQSQPMGDLVSFGTDWPPTESGVTNATLVTRPPRGCHKKGQLLICG